MEHEHTYRSLAARKPARHTRRLAHALGVATALLVAVCVAVVSASSDAAAGDRNVPTSRAGSNEPGIQHLHFQTAPIRVPAGQNSVQMAAHPPAPLQKDLRALVAAGVPGALVLVRDQRGTVRYKWGSETLAPSKPLRLDDRFRVGSVTKTFVATVVLQLEAEGVLSLDDTVEKWLPGLLPQGNQISLRMLLHHTSGLFDYLNDGDPTVLQPYLDGNTDYVWTPQQLVATATSHPLNFPPGTSWKYSNTNYIVLGLVVEKATGDTIEHQLAQRIFLPLGLTHTTFETEPALSGRHADGYIRRNGVLVDFTRLSPSFAWSAGAIASTVDDLARFEQALLAGKLLRAPQLKEMEDTSADGIASADYGLGLALVHTRCGKFWGHNGDYPGYLTFIGERVNGSRQVVLETTTDSIAGAAADAYQRVMLRALCGGGLR